MTLTYWDDVSHWNGPWNPTRMTVAKATEGTNYTDPEFAGNRSRALSKDLPFGAYHFLRPGNASAQAKYAHGVIGSTPAMLDIEVESGTFPSIADALSFISEYRSLGGVMFVSYIPKWFWSGEWKGASLKALASAGMKNINSDYSGSSDTSAMAPFGGLPNLGRQYTKTPHDMNRAPMSLAQLWSSWMNKPPVVVAHPVGSRNLLLTSPQLTGADVKWVQGHIGPAHAGSADGIFGPATKSGVEWWQKQHKIAVDGIVGPATYKTMGVTMS